MLGSRTQAFLCAWKRLGLRAGWVVGWLGGWGTGPSLGRERNRRQVGYYGHELGDSLTGTLANGFIWVIFSFPAENQQEKVKVTKGWVSHLPRQLALPAHK